MAVDSAGSQRAVVLAPPSSVGGNHICPRCNGRQPARYAPRPWSGDVTFCVHCAALLRFAGNLRRLDVVGEDALRDMQPSAQQALGVIRDLVRVRYVMRRR